MTKVGVGGIALSNSWKGFVWGGKRPLPTQVLSANVFWRRWILNWLEDTVAYQGQNYCFPDLLFYCYSLGQIYTDRFLYLMCARMAKNLFKAFLLCLLEPLPSSRCLSSLLFFLNTITQSMALESQKNIRTLLHCSVTCYSWLGSCPFTTTTHTHTDTTCSSESKIPLQLPLHILPFL